MQQENWIPICISVREVCFNLERCMALKLKKKKRERGSKKEKRWTYLCVLETNTDVHFFLVLE